MRALLSRLDHKSAVPVALSIGVAVLLVVLWQSARFSVSPSVVPAGGVVFVGSSTIARFPLDVHFPRKPCVNVGAGNETAVAARARIDYVGGLDQARGVVVYAGSADHRFDPALPSAAIRDRVADLLDLLRARTGPAVPVLLLEVLPARSQSDAQRDALRRINEDLAVLAGARGITFLRTHRPPIATPEGNLSVEHSADSHHLNDAGYRVLAAWIVEDGGEVGALLRS